MTSTASGERVGGVSVVRDGRDIIPFICGHYLRLGFDRLLFIDDGSSDGTYEFLKRLSARDTRVSLRRVELPQFEQSRLMTEGANELIAEGCHIIFPFDQDEFWNIELPAIRRAAAGKTGGLFEGKWVHFVQDRDVRASRMLNILKVSYRAPILVDRRKLAVKMGKPRLAFTMPKVGFKSDGSVSIATGQHALVRGPIEKLASELELFHFPIRTAAEIAWRRSVFPRLRKLIEPIAPHINRLTGEDREAFLDRYHGNWETNSVDSDGCIVAEDGVPVPLVPDRRLRWLLVRGWLYMMRHHPMLLIS